MNKIIETEHYVNKCECGKIITLSYFREFNEVENKYTNRAFYLHICTCGTLFITKELKHE